MTIPQEPTSNMRRWIFSLLDIEDHSPSRKDGMDSEFESHLRISYCKFIQELGKKLKLPQVKIASGIMLCHRFYMWQSHAKNDWQTIATASMFLACKITEAPRALRDVILLAYELMYAWDPLAPQRIRKERKVYDNQKQLILAGESLLLSTIAFDFDIQLPYEPLAAALKKLELTDLAKVAWNFVNDSLQTTLCLQYKPAYIAAGSVFLAATALEKTELLTKKRKVWWLEFEVSQRQLKEVIQQMAVKLLKKDRKQVSPTANGSITHSKALVQKAVVNSHQTCISSGSIVDCASSNKILVEAESLKSHNRQDVETRHSSLIIEEPQPLQTGDIGTANCAVGDGDAQVVPKILGPDQNSTDKTFPIHCIKIDTQRIREALKRRRCDTARNMQKHVAAVNAEIDYEAWIEKELENGIERGYSPSEKKHRKDVMSF